MRRLLLIGFLLTLASTSFAWQSQKPTAIKNDSTGTTVWKVNIQATQAETSVVMDVRNTDLSHILIGIQALTTDTSTFNFVLKGSIFSTLDSNKSLFVIDSGYCLSTLMSRVLYWEPGKYMSDTAQYVTRWAGADTSATGNYVGTPKVLNFPYLFLIINRKGVGTTATGATYFTIFLHTKQPG